MSGSTAWVRLNTALRLTLNVAFHSSSLMKRALSTLLALPALFTRMSIEPTFALRPSAIASQDRSRDARSSGASTGLAARLLRSRPRLRRSGSVRRPVSDDRRAFARQQQRGRPADAGATAGDERDLAVEQTHRSSYSAAARRRRDVDSRSLPRSLRRDQPLAQVVLDQLARPLGRLPQPPPPGSSSSSRSPGLEHQLALRESASPFCAPAPVRPAWPPTTPKHGCLTRSVDR